jgi:competence protein ComEA
MPQLPFSRRQAVVLTALLLVLLVAGAKLFGRSGAAAVPAPLTPTAVSAPPPAAVVVDVVGAVRRPGLYHLTDAARIADAIARAGGATAKADLQQVNLAAPIADGEQVVVPRRAAAGAVPASGAGSSTSTGPVHLSTATLEQLDGLPGVGPVTAQKILDYRAQHGAFHSVDELDAIPGIGPARLDQLRNLVAP